MITTQAVAGCNQIVCRTPPLMMCNPAEAAGSGEPFNIDTWRGRQVVLMHQGGMNSTWAPGNFGFLEVSAPGADALRDAVAGKLDAGYAGKPDQLVKAIEDCDRALAK